MLLWGGVEGKRHFFGSVALKVRFYMVCWDNRFRPPLMVGSRHWEFILFLHVQLNPSEIANLFKIGALRSEGVPVT